MINTEGLINEGSKLSQELLLVNRLSVNFETIDKTVEVLKEVSIRVEKGKIIGIVGESGSGKSTLAQTIVGVLDIPPARIVAGKIIFDGKTILPQAGEGQNFRGKGINMVFQEPLVSLNPVYTVSKQMEEAVKAIGGGSHGSDTERIIRTALEEVMIRDIDRVLNSYPHQLSGGMRQRVAIAMALIQRPKLLILDEPTTGLDLIVQRKILGLILQLRKEISSSILIITHDLAVAAIMCDRIYVMYAGRVVESGDRSDIIDDPMHPYTKMLKYSVPEGYSSSGPLKVSKGSPPDLTDLPSGCAFRTRCPKAMEICSLSVPPLKEKDGEREVACWLYE
jgi:oligopeptide/dipeptide ABC transporter ATP-binding protein